MGLDGVKSGFSKINQGAAIFFPSPFKCKGLNKVNNNKFSQQTNHVSQYPRCSVLYFMQWEFASYVIVSNLRPAGPQNHPIQSSFCSSIKVLLVWSGLNYYSGLPHFKSHARWLYISPSLSIPAVMFG